MSVTFPRHRTLLWVWLLVLFGAQVALGAVEDGHWVPSWSVSAGAHDPLLPGGERSADLLDEAQADDLMAIAEGRHSQPAFRPSRVPSLMSYPTLQPVSLSGPFRPPNRCC